MVESKDERAKTVPAEPTGARRISLIGAFVVAILFVVIGVLGVQLRSDHSAYPPQCEEIANKQRGIIFTDYKKAKANPPLFCSCLSEAARSTSSRWLAAVVPCALIGAFLTILGGALGPVEGVKAGTLPGQRGVLLAGIGALMLAFAVYGNSRATAASNVAAEAHSALALNDNRQMFAACVATKSSWMSSRVDSAGKFISSMDSRQPE